MHHRRVVDTTQLKSLSRRKTGELLFPFPVNQLLALWAGNLRRDLILTDDVLETAFASLLHWGVGRRRARFVGVNDPSVARFSALCVLLLSNMFPVQSLHHDISTY